MPAASPVATTFTSTGAAVAMEAKAKKTIRAALVTSRPVPLCGAFAKPSDGLEPSTPSL
jgi:hypothetical protein